MDIDHFISKFLEKKAEELKEFKEKYSKLKGKRSYAEWEEVYMVWTEENETLQILLSDD
jgi:hypothetical protein